MCISEAATILRWFSGAYLMRSSGHILLSLLPISCWLNRSLISWMLFCAVWFLWFFAYVLMTYVRYILDLVFNLLTAAIQRWTIAESCDGLDPWWRVAFQFWEQRCEWPRLLHGRRRDSRHHKLSPGSLRWGHKSILPSPMSVVLFMK
jgi:hypothetical protein